MNPATVVLALFFVFRPDGAMQVKVQTPDNFKDCQATLQLEAVKYEQANPGVLVRPICLTMERPSGNVQG